MAKAKAITSILALLAKEEENNNNNNADVKFQEYGAAALGALVLDNCMLRNTCLSIYPSIFIDIIISSSYLHVLI